MRSLRSWLYRLAGFVPSARRERELSEEIESHLRMHIDDNLRAGMTPQEARRDALIKLGGIEPAKQAYREQRSIPLLEHLLQDIRFALRQLRTNPGFTLTAMLMLALGLCASVAIFAFVDAALLKPLPYRDASRLVAVYERINLCPYCTLSYPDFLDWKKLNKVFDSMDIYEGRDMTLSTPDGAQSAAGARVTADFFRTLGVTPVLGRDFLPGEDQPAAPRTAVLSYAAWQKRYGGRRDVLGHTVTLSGDPTVIVGVLPPDFHFSLVGPAEFWTAIHVASTGCDPQRACHGSFAVARLKDGVSLETAQANVIAIAHQLEAQYPDSNRGQGAALRSLSDAIVGDIRTVLTVLLSGAALLLLIATVNIASLLLVRSESRKREIAIRTALGGSSARLFSQFLIEALVLVAAGSILGLASADGAMNLLTKLIPQAMRENMPYLSGLGLNLHVLAFAAAIALLATMLFAIMPTLRLSLTNSRAGLTESSRSSAGITWRRLGSRLVILELATAMVLLVGASLLGQSLHRLLHLDIGFRPEHLAHLRISSPSTTYSKDAEVIALERLILSRVAALPGVTSAGVTSLPPLVGGNTMWIRVIGHPYHGEHNEVTYREVSAGYLKTLQAHLLRGRYFNDSEDESKPLVVIIDQSLANKYFPGEDPIGKHIMYAPTPTPPMEVVGIVSDLKEGSLDKSTWPAIYVAFNQDPSVYFSLLVRTQAEQSLLPTLTSIIHEIDPGIMTSNAMTMGAFLNDSNSAWPRRSSAWLVGGFASIAFLLSVVGLYGVVAYSVSQRTREIGVRMALGARPGNVYQLILKEAGRLIAAGIVVGVMLSIAAAALMRGLLFGVSSWDVPTLTVVAAALGMAAFLASYIPARRAAGVNPVEALRAE